jgi:uncharacterized membrane protein YtjA (UPF0391 family)
MMQDAAHHALSPCVENAIESRCFAAALLVMTRCARRRDCLARSDSDRFLEPVAGSVCLTPENAELGIIQMLKWAFIFLFIAIVAAIFGFTGIASGAAAIAKILFLAALVIFVVFVVLAIMAGKALSS